MGEISFNKSNPSPSASDIRFLNLFDLLAYPLVQLTSMLIIKLYLLNFSNRAIAIKNIENIF